MKKNGFLNDMQDDNKYKWFTKMLIIIIEFVSLCLTLLISVFVACYLLFA